MPQYIVHVHHMQCVLIMSSVYTLKISKFVPVFEENLRSTPKGGISSPFRSQFGWHILYVEDRRQQDMTDALVRKQASLLLRQLRFEDELRIWLQEIRDNAHVEILI